MASHWRFCEHANTEQVYKDWIVEIGVCPDCDLRIATVSDRWPRFLTALIYMYGHWRMSRFFQEKITWWPAKEF